MPKSKAIWRKDYAGADRDQLSYEGDFGVNKINMTAVYTANGTFNVLEIEIKPAEITTKASNYLAKTIQNLIVNAIKYNSEKGKIILRNSFLKIIIW